MSQPGMLAFKKDRSCKNTAKFGDRNIKRV